MATATLTSKGQITIPVEVRHALQVGTGDRVEFVQIAPGRYVGEFSPDESGSFLVNVSGTVPQVEGGASALQPEIARSSCRSRRAATSSWQRRARSPNSRGCSASPRRSCRSRR